MKANELRIGNIVFEPLNEDKKAFKVFELYHEKDYDKINYFNALSFEPVLLTEEWMNRTAFKKDGDNKYWFPWETHYLELLNITDIWYPSVVQIPEFSHQDEQRVYLNSIQYVHEFQNLFFALSGRELQLTAL